MHSSRKVHLVRALVTRLGFSSRAMVCWRSLGVNRISPRRDKTLRTFLTLFPHLSAPSFCHRVIPRVSTRERPRRSRNNGRAAREKRRLVFCDVTQVVYTPPLSFIFHRIESNDPHSLPPRPAVAFTFGSLH